MPATPMATSVVPWRQARPNESLTITAGATPKRSAEPLADAAAADASGSLGRSTTQPSPGVFERSTPALAQTKPCSVSAMIEVVAATPDGARLAQDHLDVVVGLLDAALGLGDDLLRDDDDVALGQAARALEGVAEQRREVVPRPHLGDPLERQDLDAGHSGRPVMRTPAFVRCGG